MSYDGTSTYPLASSTWDHKELESVQRTFESNSLTYGRQVKEFEARVADFFGSNHAVMVNSGSSANLLGLASLIETRRVDTSNSRSEVIVPAVSWATTYYPISQLGLRIRLVDIDIDTLNSPFEKIEAAFSENTVGMVGVNLLGNPCQLAEIREFCDAKNIFFLEDNCESMGAKVGEAFTGTFGHVGTFSTYFSHHISTIEGGFCLTDNEELYQFMVSMRSHGWIRDLPAENLVRNREGDFHDSFRFVLPGYNLRPMEVQAAIGIEQMRKLPDFLVERRLNATKLQALAKRLEGRVRLQKETETSSWFGFSLLLESSAMDRSQVVKRLNNIGIETRPVVAGNIARHPVMDRLKVSEAPLDLPNSNLIHDTGFFVGNHHYPLDEQISLLVETLDQVLAGD